MLNLPVGLQRFALAFGVYLPRAGLRRRALAFEAQLPRRPNTTICSTPELFRTIEAIIIIVPAPFRALRDNQNNATYGSGDFAEPFGAIQTLVFTAPEHRRTFRSISFVALEPCRAC